MINKKLIDKHDTSSSPNGSSKSRGYFRVTSQNDNVRADHLKTDTSIYYWFCSENWGQSFIKQSYTRTQFIEVDFWKAPRCSMKYWVLLRDLTTGLEYIEPNSMH